MERMGETQGLNVGGTRLITNAMAAKWMLVFGKTSGKRFYCLIGMGWGHLVEVIGIGIEDIASLLHRSAACSTIPACST
jgi:hypothetical protein